MFIFLVISYLVMTNSKVLSNREMFTINTDGCKIPAFPLVSETIRDMVAPPEQVTPNCSKTPVLVTANATHVWVLNNSYDLFNIFIESDFYCCYRNFSAEGTTENVAYGICRQFTKTIKAEHEFVRVECYNSGSKIYDDLFRFNVTNMKRMRRRDNKSFNVLMIGLDGMSRKNFLRTMSQTSTFLKSRGSIQLHGYNKLGDNSFPNLFPMLTGKSFEEAKRVCFRNNMFSPNSCKFMWDMYRSAGYYTALGSDSGAGVFGTYEYMLPYKPTDFYMQPFMYETRHLYKDRTYDYHLCLQNRYVYQELLSYMRDTVTTAAHAKLFGLFWEESVSHGKVNYPYIMDDDYLNFLKDLEKSRYLEDTIIVFFSDHGTRWGEIVSTQQGRQESRLPLFEVLFPKKFRRRYRMAMKIFESNGHAFTTPYDVFETLLDLVNLPSLEERELKERMKIVNPDANGISLFLPIPLNRTCRSVGISEHWCTCLKGEKVIVSEKGKIFTSKFLIQHINQILSEYNQCHKLGIEKILDITATKSDKTRTYRVLLQTTPGSGIFEGTIVQVGGIWTISGTVSRLNAYRDQSRCVKDPIAKMYCYCKR